MSQFKLIEHATTQTWCAPTQDQQAIFTLARMTGSVGVRNIYRRGAYRFPLPVKGIDFDIFQVGQVHPTLVNLLPWARQWVRLDELCTKNAALIDLYSTDGVMHPRSQAWYLITEERNVIIAVAHRNEIPIRYADEKLHLRVHRNQSHVRRGLSEPGHAVAVVGQKLNTLEEARLFLVQYDEYAKKPGRVLMWRNGLIVTQPTVAQCEGAYCELLWDHSVLNVLFYDLSKLSTFESQLDQRYKYLVHLPAGITPYVTYEDDIDLHLVGEAASGACEGVHYHKNRTENLRNLSHRDFSIPVDQVVALRTRWKDKITVNNARIMVVVREGGVQRAVPNEHHRLRELYRLPESEILKAMVGVDSTVRVWRAGELESSGYAQLIGTDWPKITAGLVTRAYGYNACLDVLAKPFQKVNPGETVEVPVGYRQHCTVFEYDREGLLLRWGRNSGMQYIVSQGGYYLEYVHGDCGLKIEEYIDQSGIAITDDVDWRMYVCSRDTDAQNQNWFDVTQDNRYWALIDGKVHWTCSATHHTLLRSNRHAMLKVHELSLGSGYAAFNLTNLQTVDGVESERVMEVPMGEIDIWLNRRQLIEGLDFVVDFPRVWIHNKTHLVSTLIQSLVVRLKGHPEKDLKGLQRLEAGFVRNDVLSVNGRYNVRNGLAVKTVVAGRVFDMSELGFNEEGASFLLHSNFNGQPYDLRDLVNPIRAYTGEDTYALRAISRAVDEEVGNYLSKRLVQQEPSTINPIAGYYRVYSPFLSKLIHDLASGVFQPDLISKQYTDMQMEACLKDYLPMLMFDPLHEDRQPDTNYVRIDPHCRATAISVTPHQYAFVQRVVRRYARGLVELSTHLVLN